MWREQYNNIKRSNQFDSAVERGTSWHCILWCCAAGFWWSMSYNMLLIPSSLSMMEPVGCALVTFGAKERWCITFDFLKGSGAVCVPSNIGDAQTRRGVSVLGFNSTSGWSCENCCSSKQVCVLFEVFLHGVFAARSIFATNIINCEYNQLRKTYLRSRASSTKHQLSILLVTCSCTIHVPAKLIVGLLY